MAVVIDFSKHMNRIVELDPDGRTAWVEPGCVLDDLRNAAEEHGLTFGPDPSTHNHCTLGGMAGNNSCGVHSVMVGRTSDNIEEMEVLTHDGQRLLVGPTPDEELERIIAGGGRLAEIYAALKGLRDRYGELIRERYPRIPRRVSGYNLDDLLPEKGFNVARALVGSEGTCVTILRLKCRLVPSPPNSVLLVLGFEDVYAAAEAVPLMREAGAIACEGIDGKFVDFMHRQHLFEQYLPLLPEGCGWLFVEFGGETVEEAAGQGRAATDALGRDPNARTSGCSRTRRSRRRSGRYARSGCPPPRTCPGSASPTRAGRTPPSRPSG